MDEGTLLGTFPDVGNNALGALAKMKLKALRIWAINKIQEHQGDETLLNVMEFTQVECRKIQRKIALQGKGDQPDTKSAFSGKLGTFTGKMKDWPTANRKLLSYLSQQRGLSQTPLSYVIRIETDRPEHLDEIQEEFWGAPLQGSYFDKDNYSVYQILKEWTSDGTADTYVDRFNDTSDGRSAYILLLQNFEGDDARQTAIAQARQIIQSAHYHKDTQNFTFDDYCNKHIAANNELDRRNVSLDGPSQVIAFLHGIKNQDFKAIKPNIISSIETNADLSKAISTFKKQIQQVFNYPRGMSNDKKRDQRNDRKR